MLALMSSLVLHKSYPNRNIKWKEIQLCRIYTRCSPSHESQNQSTILLSHLILVTVAIEDASFENVKLQDKIGTAVPFFFLKPKKSAKEPAGTDTEKLCGVRCNHFEGSEFHVSQNGSNLI